MIVENWLCRIKLSQCVEVLRDNGIGAEVLADLAEADPDYCRRRKVADGDSPNSPR